MSQLQQTVKDVVCPNCFHELPFPEIVSQGTDRYGRELRTYFAWCFNCDIGCEVIQFAKDTPTGKRWAIHKYQHYKLVGQANCCIPTGQWKILNELPEPAPAVTGPGGDYDKHFEPETIELVKTMLTALKSATQTIENLLKIVSRNSKVKND